MERISVIIPAYNAGSTLRRCLDSILAQNYENLEIIISDDNSDDDTGKIAKAYAQNGKCRYIKNYPNHGVAYTRNRGLFAATGVIIGFCDADDQWKPDKLNKQLAYLHAHPEGKIVFTLNENRYEGGHAGEFGKNTARNSDMDKQSLRTALIRKSIFEQYGYFDESLRRREDIQWVARLLAGREKCACLEERLYIRNLLDSGLSMTIDQENWKKQRLQAIAAGIRGKKASDDCELSVIIPMYNAEKYIGEAMASVQSQSVPLELIIVDDGSTDKSTGMVEKIISEYTAETEAHYPVTLSYSQHKGQAAARNTGLAMARKKWIFFLDADDVLTPGALEKMLAEAGDESPWITAMCEDFISPELTEAERKNLIPAQEPYERLLAGCMLIKRSLFEKYGAFDETMKSSETAQWVMRIRDAGLSPKRLELVTLKRRFHLTNLGRVSRQTQMESYAAMIRERVKKRR